MVAHRWAQLNTNGAARGFAMFYEGRTVYSWGHHFPIAQWVETTPARGAKDVPGLVVLFNADGYSTSTAKHKTLVRRAIRASATVFELPKEFWPVHGNAQNVTEAEKRAANRRVSEEALRWYEQTARDYFHKAARARTYVDHYLNAAESTLREAEDFARCFGVKWERPALADLEERAEKARALAAKAAKKREREERKKRELRKIATKRDLEAWLAGEEFVRFPYEHNPEDGSALIRRNGDQLETSRGASVPWAHAVKAFRFIKLVRDAGSTWERNGKLIRVGHFTVDSVDEHGNMRAGCHLFKWSEIERLARKEGVYDDTPSDEALEDSGAH